MIEIATYLFSALIVGVSAWFTWFAMGSPYGNTGKPGESRVYMGYIFSFVGVWVIKRFNAREKKENDRLEVLHRASSRLIQSRFKSIVGARTQNDFYRIIAEPEHEEARITYNDELIKLKATNEQMRRANPWKIAGACLPCFSWWFGAFFACVFCAFGAIQINIFLPFFPIVVSAFSVLTMKQFNNE